MTEPNDAQANDGGLSEEDKLAVEGKQHFDEHGSYPEGYDDEGKPNMDFHTQKAADAKTAEDAEKDKKPEEKPKEPEEPAEGKPAEGEEGAEGEEAGKEPPVARKTKFMPVGKHTRIVGDLKQEIEDLKTKAQSTNKPEDKAEVEDKIKEVAKVFSEKLGIEPEDAEAFAKAIIDNTPKGLGEEDQALFNKMKENDVWKKEDETFDKDWDTAIDALKDDPRIEEIKKAKEEIKTSAFTDEYAGTPISTIIKEYLFDNPAGKAGAESGRGDPAKGSGKAVDFDKLKPEDIDAMKSDPELYKAYEDHQKAKHGEIL